MIWALKCSCSTEQKGEGGLICHEGRCKKLRILHLLTFKHLLNSDCFLCKKAPKTQQNPSKEPASYFFLSVNSTSRLQSEGCDCTYKVIVAALSGALFDVARRTTCSPPPLLGHRLTCWGSCELPCKQVGAELRFPLSSSQAPGWELDPDPHPWQRIV